MLKSSSRKPSASAETDTNDERSRARSHGYGIQSAKGDEDQLTIGNFGCAPAHVVDWGVSYPDALRIRAKLKRRIHPIEHSCERFLANPRHVSALPLLR